MSILQSNLPYDHDALEPHVSANTLSYHYDKHHAGYVSKLNKMIKDTSYDDLALEQVIDAARKK
ncbi:MAG: superoxide dismutase [Fe], partial [Gammaproteobacteria bacterium]|nr:superoxide dismutase [Fe] [Gammaproteobacteria bacterium]